MIIAIESASTDVSVALATPEGELLAGDAWSSQHRQGHELLPRLLRVLGDASVELTAVTALGVGIGPGSFTGLRVGMSIAKGLAYALRRPIVGVPSLSAWLTAEPKAGAAVARAGAHEAYQLLRDASTVRLVPVDGLPDQVRTSRVVAPTELHEAFALRGAVAPLGAAAAVARDVAERLASTPEGDDLSRLEPAYLRVPRGTEQVTTEGMQWP